MRSLASIAPTTEPWSERSPLEGAGAAAGAGVTDDAIDDATDDPMDDATDDPMDDVTDDPMDDRMDDPTDDAIDDAAGVAGAAVALGACPWLWPVSCPAARCGKLASISKSASALPVSITSPAFP
jgi:hypothetical protein